LKTATPGIYKVRIENALSVLDKTFKVVPAGIFVNQSLHACPGGAVTFNGVIFNAAHPQDTFVYSLPNGLDSTVTVHFQEYPNTRDTLNFVLNTNETYTVQGQVLNTAGTYTFVLVNQYGCDSTLMVNLVYLVGTQNLKDAANVRVIPQPLKDIAQVWVDPNWRFSTLSIYAASGQLVIQQKIAAGAQSMTIDLSKQNSGVYYLILEGLDGRAVTSILKQ
jgi:hypothetical protein